jgi:cyclophilin family peptidyl-prolyl cis-trans isomerase
MTRVAALVVLAVIIVGSGFWLARERSTPSGSVPGDAAGASVSASPTPATPEAPAEEAPAVAEASPDSPEVGEERQASAPDGAELEAEAGEDPGADGDATAAGPLAPVALPDGYTQVDYLSEAPVQAFDAPRQVLDAGLEYAAVLRTNRGDITVDLFEDAAPQTVNNFAFLALNHYYDGVPFHRVLEGFMAQTGDPTGTGRGGPGYAFDDEIAPELSFDARGVLAMANAGKDAQGNGTNGSQFFLTFEPTPWLDGNHTIFGRVVAGDPVLDEITRIDPNTPSAIAFFDDTLAQLREQGVDIPGADDEKVSDAIEALLGALPLAGQTFAVAGQTAVVGTAGGNQAFGFWPAPDELLTVVIAARPR